ncbi:NUDIX domain-containing protein [Acidocella sp.]|uniref:NUDIX domain-containing protein n=1 Tax=Acidocella sp. TaxID=50710 RepID=UPI003D06E173
MAEIFQDHMLVSTPLQTEIAHRCRAGRFPDEPTAVANDLGLLELPGGHVTRVWLCHAADCVLLDDLGQIVLITRRHAPGQGKQALPGGLLDSDGAKGVEQSRLAALREATEETGISSILLAKAEITQLGHRRHERPFDIRRAWNNLPGTPVRKDELFTVSTLGFRVKIHGDLHSIPLEAGDDATAITIRRARDVGADELAVPDHYDMIRAALDV